MALDKYYIIPQLFSKSLDLYAPLEVTLALVMTADSYLLIY